MSKAEPPLGEHAHVVVVGASLAGLRGAEALREEGFAGRITLVGDESSEPYDRPPLSKQVLMGRASPERTRLPRRVDLGEVEWILGNAAVHLDRVQRRVELADGRAIGYDRLLIATGVRNREWIHPDQAALDGVLSVRTARDASQLSGLLDRGPDRVVVIGGGFTGSEIASVCRSLGVDITLVERGSGPLAGALGSVVGAIAADVQREHGVDLRVETEVETIEGDRDGRVRRVVLSDGTSVEAEVVVVALGALRNVEWLEGSRLAAGPLGVSTDAGCRAFDIDGLVAEDVFVAGDVARFPHPLYGYEFLSLEHWENALSMAEIAAHNMVRAPAERLPHISVPAFWSIQFGLNVKSVGVPSFGDEILFTQGSVEERSFVAAYGKEGRVVAAVLLDQAKWLDFYRAQIERAACFPLDLRADDGPTRDGPIDAGFVRPAIPYHPPTVVTSGHDPHQKRANIRQPHGASR
jgi:3-phenylpropionate/trans-cinnamate dioxygenase ferredoxin reductase component